MVSETIAIAAKARIKNEAINKSVVIDASYSLVWLVQETNSPRVTWFHGLEGAIAALQSLRGALLRRRMSPDIRDRDHIHRETTESPMNPAGCTPTGPADWDAKDSPPTY